MTGIIGELTAGTVEKKKSTRKCRTCGAVDQKLTSGDYCWDPNACARRRMEKASGKQHLRFPCVVKLLARGGTYYLREFGPKMTPMPQVLPPGFTAKDYEANPAHKYFEAVMEVGQATSFQVVRALELARIFNGKAVNK
jgi:hypothetical protein